MRALLRGPHLLAFLPAITLAGYWLGGETVLVMISLLMPAAFAIAGLYSADARNSATVIDPVTELPLRSWLCDQADLILAEGPTRRSTTASLAVEIDEFEDLAERHGSTAGQAILRASANRIREVIRDTDLIARLDGPRFGVVVHGDVYPDLETLIQLSVRIQRQLEEVVSIGGARIYVSGSVGFCVPKMAPSPEGETLVICAEQALDDALTSGTGTIRGFSGEMQERAVVQNALSEELPLALEEPQIKPWFQPQISTDTGQVSGLEVLARWEHPSRGLISPSEFLSAVENLGLMERLGEVMLYHTLNALRAWDATGLNIPCVSVNFSAEELRNPMIVERIRWELDRFEIDPSRLTIEVLETVIARSANDTIIRNLRAFAELGCTIDLDDFGTGHASIANIKRFSVSRIKIDRSFVTRIDTDNEQQSIVSAIITLAKRLEIGTLAEGVENAAEQAVLRKLGCQDVQGYGIARPMRFSDVEPWLQTYNKRLGVTRSPTANDPSDQGAQTQAIHGKTA